MVRLCCFRVFSAWAASEHASCTNDREWLRLVYSCVRAWKYLISTHKVALCRIHLLLCKFVVNHPEGALNFFVTCQTLNLRWTALPYHNHEFLPQGELKTATHTSTDEPHGGRRLFPLREANMCGRITDIVTGLYLWGCECRALVC